MSEDIGFKEIESRTNLDLQDSHTVERFSYSILGRVSQNPNVETTQRKICELLINRIQNGMGPGEAAHEVEDSFEDSST